MSGCGVVLSVSEGRDSVGGRVRHPRWCRHSTCRGHPVPAQSCACMWAGKGGVRISASRVPPCQLSGGPSPGH